MKKTFIYSILAITALTLSFVSCSKKNKAETADCCKKDGDIVTLKAVVDLVPHQEIIEYAGPALLKEGIKVSLHQQV